MYALADPVFYIAWCFLVYQYMLVIMAYALHFSSANTFIVQSNLPVLL